MVKTVQDAFDLWSRDAVSVEPVLELVSKEEIDRIAAGVHSELRDRLEWAFWSLGRVLRRNPEIQEDWKQLVVLYRNQAGPVNDTAIFTFPDGEAVEIPIVIDRNTFQYNEILQDVAGLVIVLDEIENFNPDKYKSTKLVSRIQGSWARGGLGGDSDAAKKYLEKHYLSARHGEKKSVKQKAVSLFGISERQVDLLVAQLKKGK